MAGQNKQPTEETNKNLSTFVKQLLLLVLPAKNKNIVNTGSNSNSNDSTSPFEKMYFSFPALDEDLEANTKTCGQHHHQASHERSDVVKSTNNNGILC